MNYPIIGIVGDRGEGKSVTLTKIADEVAEQGLNIFANFNLYGIEYTHIEFNDIIDFPEYLENGVILIDEAHIGTDAYAFFSKRVQDITKFITQTRKRHLTFIYATQILTQVAKRLRDLTNFIWYCKKIDDTVFYVEVHNRDIDSYVNSFIYDGTPYFPMYDTDQIIELPDEK